MTAELLKKYRDERSLKANLGVSFKVLEKLLSIFSVLYEENRSAKYEASLNLGKRKRRAGGGRKKKLKTDMDKLIFVLYYLKIYPTFDVLATTFGISRSVAHDNIQELLPILRESLDELEVVPKRCFTSINEFENYFKEKDIESLLIDATERAHFRPKDKDKRDPLYSGKQKSFTMKNTIISDVSRFIYFLGLTTQGSMHDFSLLKLELAPQKGWFSNFKIWVDLGYLGIGKDYKIKELLIPTKRPPSKKEEAKKELTEEEKAHNKSVNSVRVLVEHAIGGVKRLGILNQVFRNKKKGMDDLVMEIGAGLWNLHLSLKNT